MTRRKRLWTQILLVVLATGIVTGGSYLIDRLGFFKTADYLFFDLRMHWRGPLKPSGNLVLVLMDEASSKELQRRKGTWSRAQLASALENLCRAGAEIIGLDIVLASPDIDPEIDNHLAKAIYDCNNVVLARILSGSGAGEIGPLPLFQEGMIGDGFIDVDLDEDEVLRRVRFLNAKPHPSGGVQLLPSFSLELARTFLNVEFDFDLSREDAMGMGSTGGRQLWLPYPELLIDYVGTHREFPRLSYADVVHNRFEKTSVEGKLILIGSSLLLQKDFFVTPMSRFRRSESVHQDKFGTLLKQVDSRRDLGVACHANAIEAILGQRFLRTVPDGWLPGLVIAAGLLGMVFYLPRLHLGWAGSILAGYLAGVIALGYLLFLNFGLSVDVTQFLVIFSGQFVAGVAYQRKVARRKALFVQNLFGKYVSPEVVRELVSGQAELSLEGRRCELTVLFSDLRGFTSLSEKLDAKQTGTLLNQYFNTVIPVIFDNKGTVDKLMGDAIMAFFGAPVRLENHAASAAAAALQMLESLARFRNSGIPGADQLFAGIGINTGTVVLGNLGSDRFMDYTVIGDAVNLGSRLEGLNKVYGTEIIISDASVKQLDERFLLRELDLVQVKGKETAVVIYELAGYRDAMDEARIQAVELFRSGLESYRGQRWEEATERFQQVLEQTPGDTAARLYLQRIEQYRVSDLPDSWIGVTVFDHK